MNKFYVQNEKELFGSLNYIMFSESHLFGALDELERKKDAEPAEAKL